MRFKSAVKLSRLIAIREHGEASRRSFSGSSALALE